MEAKTTSPNARVRRGPNCDRDCEDHRTDAEIEAEIIRQQYASVEDSTADNYPHLSNLSGAFFYRFLPYPDVPKLPEYVYIPMPSRAEGYEQAMEVEVAIAKWNWAWEADHLRYDVFEEMLPSQLQWLKAYRGQNLCLVPDAGATRYGAYSALYHLLPRSVLEQHGLPLLRRGLWPVLFQDDWVERVLPTNFELRLANAFAAHIWSNLSPCSTLDKFSKTEPLRLLSHNLDFWLPHIDSVIRNRLRSHPRVEIETPKQAKDLRRARKARPPAVQLDRPLKGGYVWVGEDEARDAADELVEQADNEGKLRAIIDDIRSHRVEEDFSDRWSFEREDFERRLFHKRSKTKVSFVELTDTIPVHGPESEVYENMIYEDFIALLNPRERQIVVCLRNGYTKLGDVAQTLGYANHSPVSKALARIRDKAKGYLTS
jgi:hypothetical protein